MDLLLTCLAMLYLRWVPFVVLYGDYSVPRWPSKTASSSLVSTMPLVVDCYKVAFLCQLCANSDRLSAC